MLSTLLLFMYISGDNADSSIQKESHGLLQKMGFQSQAIMACVWNGPIKGDGTYIFLTKRGGNYHCKIDVWKKMNSTIMYKYTVLDQTPNGILTYNLERVEEKHSKRPTLRVSDAGSSKAGPELITTEALVQIDGKEHEKTSGEIPQQTSLFSNNISVFSKNYTNTEIGTTVSPDLKLTKDMTPSKIHSSGKKKPSRARKPSKPRKKKTSKSSSGLGSWLSGLFGGSQDEQRQDDYYSHKLRTYCFRDSGDEYKDTTIWLFTDSHNDKIKVNEYVKGYAWLVGLGSLWTNERDIRWVNWWLDNCDLYFIASNSKIIKFSTSRQRGETLYRTNTNIHHLSLDKKRNMLIFATTGSQQTGGGGVTTYFNYLYIDGPSREPGRLTYFKSDIFDMAVAPKYSVFYFFTDKQQIFKCSFKYLQNVRCKGIQKHSFQLYDSTRMQVFQNGLHVYCYSSSNGATKYYFYFQGSKPTIIYGKEGCRSWYLLSGYLYLCEHETRIFDNRFQKVGYFNLPTGVSNPMLTTN